VRVWAWSGCLCVCVMILQLFMESSATNVVHSQKSTICIRKAKQNDFLISTCHKKQLQNAILKAKRQNEWESGNRHLKFTSQTEQNAQITAERCNQRQLKNKCTHAAKKKYDIHWEKMKKFPFMLKLMRIVYTFV